MRVHGRYQRVIAIVRTGLWVGGYAHATLRGIVCLGVCDVSMMTFPTGVFLFFTRVDEAFMADEQVASREVLAAEVAYEGLLFCMGTNVALKMFLRNGQYGCRIGVVGADCRGLRRCRVAGLTSRAKRR